MALHKDYIMRMIEQFIQAVQRILFLQHKQEYNQALIEIDEAGEKFVGISVKLFEKLHYSQLTALVNLGGIVNVEKCAILGQLLKIQGDIYGDIKNERSGSSYTHALALYLEAYLNSKTSPPENYAAVINELLAKIEALNPDHDLLRKLFQYHEAEGQYAKAEDRLFSLVTLAPGPEPIEQGLAFYQRLQHKTDVELEQGNLSRQEIVEGIQELKTLKG